MPLPRRLPRWDDGTGAVRPLGNLTPDPDPLPGSDFTVQAVPESDLAEFDLWDEFESVTGGKYAGVKDQDGRGACNGFAAATSLEWARWLAGHDWTPLSPWYVYAILCNGVDRGSNISQALRLLSERGTPREPAVPYGTINPRAIPAAAHGEARRFRIEVGRRLTSWEDLLTATAYREPFNLSVAAGGMFNSIDDDGCIVSTGAVNNHAVCAGLGLKKTRRGWAILGQNSWGTRWGLGGFFRVTRDVLRFNSSFDAYTVRAVHSDPDDPDAPAPAAARSRGARP
jgi:hypothetical protein